jgi:hypothetical protein
VPERITQDLTAHQFGTPIRWIVLESPPNCADAPHVSSTATGQIRPNSSEKMKNQINGIKVLKKGLRRLSDGKYFPAWYSRTVLINGREAVTIYAKSILSGLPRELNPENDSDMRTDYFEKDRTRFYLGTPEFNLLAQFV